MNSKINIVCGNLIVRLVENMHELEQAQKLRYNVLILEYNEEKQADGTDASEYDKYCDHLVAIDSLTNKVVGTYRLMSNCNLPKNSAFVCESEFNVDKLKSCGDSILELGRAVVDKEYRNGVVIKMLWKGLYEYCKINKIKYLFGMGCFHGINTDDYKHAFSWLHYNHKIDDDHDCYAKQPCMKMDVLKQTEVDAVQAKREMPPLIKSYVSMGSKVGTGVYIDPDFNSTDVLVIMNLEQINKPFASRMFGWEFDND